jgi:nicotinamide phosphoribosyltransferase
MFEINRIIDTDSYKASHFLQYPPNTTRAFFYLESRGSDSDWNETVFFGLQYIAEKLFSRAVYAGRWSKKRAKSSRRTVCRLITQAGRI